MASNLNPRTWKPGMTLINRQGCLCKLLAPVWNGYAWVQYLSEEVSETTDFVRNPFLSQCSPPVTENVSQLHPAFENVDTHYSCY